MKIAVLGLWHQGVVGAACLADMGHEVVGADPDAGRVARLREGRAPVFEPGLDELLGNGLTSRRLAVTADYGEAVQNAQYVFVMFDTPVNDDDESDLTEIFRAFEAIAPTLRSDATILVTAQVPVGTCEALATVLRKTAPACSATIAYMPENLRLGQAIERFMRPALPVIGCDDAATFGRLLLVLRPLGQDWHRVTVRTAEMLKHALNSFLALGICFANELGNICDAVGADGKSVGELMRLEPRVGGKAMLTPGLGFAGGTLARDMQTLRRLGRSFNVDTPLLDGAWRANSEQNRLVVRKLARAFPALKGARVAVLGLTYKPDTSTLRRSAAIEVIADLAAAGAIVTAHDPRADREELKTYSGFEMFADPLAAIARAEALVLMTPWQEYEKIDFETVRRAMAGRYVLDTAGLWNAGQLTALGFVYDDIGRGRQAEYREQRGD